MELLNGKPEELTTRILPVTVQFAAPVFNFFLEIEDHTFTIKVLYRVGGPVPGQFGIPFRVFG